MKESDIVRAILKYLKTVPDCFCWKEHGGMYGTAGIPDIKRQNHGFAEFSYQQNTEMRWKSCCCQVC